MRKFTTCLVCTTDNNVLCHTCQRYLHAYDLPTQLDYCDGVVIGRHYDRIIKLLINQLKYKGNQQVSDFLGKKLALLLQVSEFGNLLGSHTIITHVPVHRVKQYFTRGYNQSLLLAKYIAQYLDISHHTLLSKKRRTKDQKSLSRSKRLNNIQGSFHALEGKSYTNPTFILVDDIITTGSTIQECGRMLHGQYPGCKVIAVSIARNR